jgi:hypothetical protein
LVVAGFILMMGTSTEMMAQLKPEVRVGQTPGYYSAQYLERGVAVPPLPANPFPEMKVYPLGKGDFVYDDLGFDYERHREETRLEAELNGMFQDAVAAPLALSYGPNDHWLTIHDVGLDPVLGWVAHLTIHKPLNDTHLSHDLVYTTSLNAPIQWKFLMRSASTEVTARWMCSERCFFALTPTRSGKLAVSTQKTALELARRLVPPSVEVQNATFTGTNVARGKFANGNECGLPIDSGVILSSGPISAAPGPNDDDGSIAAGPTLTGPANLYPTLGDADLSALLGGGKTVDAAVLEFDVRSASAFVLTFQYVYASEEYPEWISQYNDPMAIFVNGTAPANNLAVLPGTSLPVSVSSINGGCVEKFTPAANPVYYADNHDGGNPYATYHALDPYAVLAPVFNVQYDGMTVLLKAQTTIPANVTRHVKIAIADYAGDNEDHCWSSTVFLKAWSPEPCQP